MNGESERKNKDDERKKRHGYEMKKRKKNSWKVMEIINDKKVQFSGKQFSHSKSFLRNQENNVWNTKQTNNDCWFEIEGCVDAIFKMKIVKIHWY